LCHCKFLLFCFLKGTPITYDVIHVVTAVSIILLSFLFRAQTSHPYISTDTSYNIRIKAYNI
jgi:hypothetical protein